MKGQKKKQNGITLIALVISIIVMLILAGVSLNATIGENGILRGAQDAAFMQSIAYLQETMNYDYVNKYANDELATLEAYIRDGWIVRILSSGEDETIDIKYIFQKGNLAEDVQKNLRGGDGIPAQLRDVYGINSNLEVWYIDSDGNTYGKTPENLQLDENEHIEFADENFKLLVGDKIGKNPNSVTVRDIQKITNLTLSGENVKNLDDLYYFPNLKVLTISDIHLENIDGIVYAQNLQQFSVSGTATIADWSGITGLRTLDILDIVGKENADGSNISNLTDEELSRIVQYIGGIGKLTKLYIRYNDITSVACLDNMQNKSTIEVIYFDGCKRLSSWHGIENFSNLVRIDHVKANALTDESAIVGKNNMWRVQITNNGLGVNLEFLTGKTKLTELDLSNTKITDLSGLVSLVNDSSHKFNFVLLNGNTITDTDNIPNLAPLLNSSRCTTFKIDDVYRAQLDTSLAVYENQGLTSIDTVLGGITDNSLKTLKLGNNTGLTNTSLNYFKTHNFSNVEYLYLNKTGITSLEWMLNDSGNCVFPKLKQLCVYDCDSLTSLNGLSKCTQLQWLDCSNCDRLTENSFHSGSTYYLPNSIIKLTAYTCSRLDSLAGIANLSNLVYIDFVDTAISGDNALTLNNLTRITSIHFGNNGGSIKNINITGIIPTINRCTSRFSIERDYRVDMLKMLNNSNVTRLALSSGGETIDYTMLGTRTCPYFQIESLDLSNATNLQVLDLNNLYIREVKLPRSN